MTARAATEEGPVGLARWVDKGAWAAASVAFVVACVPFFFAPGLSEDERRLRLNPIYGDLSEFFARMVTPRGLLEKPVSNFLLSLLAQVDDYHRWPFLTVAIVAHVVNVALLVRLCRALGLSRSWGALLFLVHPLALHTVITCFGITYSIPLALCLWGLTHALRTPGSSLGAALGVHLCVFAGLVLLKQSFVVYPVLLLALLWWKGRVELGPRTVAVGAVVGTLAVGFVYLYWLRYGQRAHYDPLAFAHGQLGSLPRTALLYLFPPHYQFEQELSVRPQTGPVALGALMVVGTIAVLVRFRRSPFAIAGVLALSLFLPTNSFMPREQLVLKWRLYPALALGCVAIGAALEGLAGARGPRRRGWLAHGSMALVSLVLIGSLWRDAWLLRSESRYMGSLARRLPRPSYFALTCIGLVREKQHERAKVCVVRLDEIARESTPGVLARTFFTDAVKLGLLREDTELALSWLPPEAPAGGQAPP